MLAVRELGFSVGLYAAYGLVMEMIYLLGFWVVGAAIFWRKSNDRVALFFSVVLVIFGTLNAINLSVGIHPALDLLANLFSFFAYLAFFASFYVFPNGRFVPRWTRWMVIAWALYLADLSFLPEDSPLYPARWPLLLTMALVVALFGSIVFAQAYRYRRASGPGERQQTKWVVFGLVAAIAGTFVAALPAVIIPEYVRSGIPMILYALFELSLTNLALLLIPLSIGFAILRYRLWDIDVIINRAGLRDPHHSTGPGLLRWRDDAAGDISHTHRRRIRFGHHRFNARDRCLVRATSAPNSCVHRQMLLQKEVRH
jgi:hypothetical protein